MRVFLTGGTGTIGRAIVDRLRERGDDAVILTRSAERARATLPAGVDLVEGDSALGGAWQERLAGCDAVVNLAGQSIAGARWNARYRQRIRDSRVETTRYVVEGIAALPAEQRPTVLASASGADYYPFSDDLGGKIDDDDDITEDDPPGDSALARICRAWEAEAARAENHGVRVVRMRTGIVLGGDEGALDKMKTPFKLFVGGRIGNGKQWMAWIHIADAAAGYLRALDDPALSGPVNLVSPEPVRNRDFSAALGKALGRPSWLPVPAFALRLAVGELSEYLLHGRKVVPKVLHDAGFTWQFPDLESALADAI